MDPKHVGVVLIFFKHSLFLTTELMYTVCISLPLKCWNLKVSLPVLPNFKQNLMHMCCVLSLSFFEEGEIAEAIAYTSQA
jgi:hypothetical protein